MKGRARRDGYPVTALENQKRFLEKAIFRLRRRARAALALRPRLASGGDPWLTQVEGHGARITDEGIARIRARIGKGFEGRRPWRTEVTKDAAYHMALGIGDLSPLYHDEAYAKRTKWGGLLAPYIMIQTFDTLRSVGHSGLPEGLPGVHSIWTGSLFEWKRPLKVGDADPRRLVPEGRRRAREQVRRRPLRLPDLRGRLLRPDRRQDRAPQRHLDPHRAPQDRRDEEVRRRSSSRSGRPRRSRS